jgi:hypothetical protein
MSRLPRHAASPYLDRIGEILAGVLLGRVDVAKISPSVAEAGDDSLPATARHQGGWIMRKCEVAAEVAFGRVGAHGVRVSRMSVVPAHHADAARPGDAKLLSASGLRHAQVIDCKGQ